MGFATPAPAGDDTEERGGELLGTSAGEVTPVATGSMRNVLRAGEIEILAPRGAYDGRSRRLRENTLGCRRKKEGNGDTGQPNLGLEITASVTICQVRN